MLRLQGCCLLPTEHRGHINLSIVSSYLDSSQGKIDAPAKACLHGARTCLKFVKVGFKATALPAYYGSSY